MNTVTIKQVMQPGQGKKMGKLCVEHNGQDVWLVCWPDKLAGLNPGMIVDLDWQQESFQGKDGRTVTTNKLTNVGKATGQSRPSESHAKPDAKAREMFVMGVVGRAMGSGKFAAKDIAALTANAKMAWDDFYLAETTVTNKPGSGVGSDLDDDLSEMPF